jgi:hypothetical protein
MTKQPLRGRKIAALEAHARKVSRLNLTEETLNLLIELAKAFECAFSRCGSSYY